MPSSLPCCPAVPAKVLTSPAGVMRRMVPVASVLPRLASPPK
jgi:hypothetical protein